MSQLNKDVLKIYNFIYDEDIKAIKVTLQI